MKSVLCILLVCSFNMLFLPNSEALSLTKVQNKNTVNITNHLRVHEAYKLPYRNTVYQGLTLRSVETKNVYFNFFVTSSGFGLFFRLTN